MDLPDADRARLGGPPSAPRAPGWALVRRLIASFHPDQADPLTARLMSEFVEASALLYASPARLHRALPDEPPLVELLVAARDLFLHSLGERIGQRPILSDDRSVRDYLTAAMAHLPAEQVRVLHLNTKNELLRDEVVSWGSVNRVDIAPREIIRRALDLGATGLLLAHNHPSGDPTPSSSDVTLTRNLFEAARLFEISLLDHIVVARRGCYSFRAAGRL